MPRARIEVIIVFWKEGVKIELPPIPTFPRKGGRREVVKKWIW